MEAESNRTSEVVRRALRALERSGKLTPEEVVSTAQNPEHPLHPYFDWDDSVAASKWRLEQARGLIRSVTVKVVMENDRLIPAPVYVRDPDAASASQGYVAMSSLKDDPAAARAAMSIELMRVEGLLERSERMADVLGLTDDVKRLGRRVKALRSRVQPAAQA